MNTDKVTRVEVIDHTECPYCGGSGRIYSMKNANKYIECGVCEGLGMPGRNVIIWDEAKQVDLEFQDDGRTLKIFIHPRYEK